MGPGTLTEVLKTLPTFENPCLLVGGETMDDAGVYQLNPEMALVQTVDFFTPMVDDPYIFGQVAAANSLSDVYAMGAQPLTAMNIITFPTNCLDLGVLRDIMAGGAEKILEAGAVLVGGHTVEDEVPKYGLAVTGLVHPQKVWTNQGAQEGDVLVLTKPIGVGILTTAIKGGLVTPQEEEAVTRTMVALNKGAAEAAKTIEVHGCTDVTGFGLLGHALEMVKDSAVGFTIDLEKVPVLEGALEYAAMGIVPGGAKRNLAYLEPYLSWQGEVSEAQKDLLCDPQTSGGLLLAMPEKAAQDFLQALKAQGQQGTIIGTVGGENPGKITIRGK